MINPLIDSFINTLLSQIRYQQMSEQQPVIQPLFHYTYRQEGVILDQQYNYQGNLLAVCNSNGEIFFYSAETQEQNREPLYSNDRKRGMERKNAAVLKIAWSLPIFGLFASASISHEIDLFTCSKSSVSQLLCRKLPYIPLSISFCPIQSQVLLAVGLSDGSIMILNDQLHDIATVNAHDQAVNCLAWDHKVLNYQKNKWIINNFSHVNKTTAMNQPPLMVSGSSDGYMKLWRWEQNRLTELYRFPAHHKAIRDVQWKTSFLFDADRFVITCSQDGYVSIWKLKGMKLEKKQTREFKGPVYKANFNFLGNMIAISFCNETEERVQTVILKEKNGSLMGEQIKIYS